MATRGSAGVGRWIDRWSTKRVRWATLAGLIALAGLTPLASATPASDGNPDLPPGCGIDATLVLDHSGSISSSEATLVRNAAALFANALVGTPSQLKVVTFSTRAQGISSGGTSTSNLGNVVFRDPASYAAPTSGGGSGGTNWDDGLEVVRRSSGGPGDLVVFITDGDPTYRNTTQPDGHLNDGSHAISGDGSTVSAANVTAAETEADLIKAAGAHMFGIGVGLTGASSEDRLSQVTGDEELTLDGSGNPNMAFGDADYTITSDFTKLQAVVAAFVRDLCAPSLNVTKYLQKADGTTSVAGASNPWTFTAAVSPTPSDWRSPDAATGASATLTTGASGGVSFNWATDANTSTVNLSEQAQPGWVYNGAKCTRNLLDGSTPQVIFDSVGQNAAGAQKSPTELDGIQVGLQQAVNCAVYNRQVRTSTIQVTKQTLPAGLPTDFDFTLTSGQATVGTIDDLSHGETGTFAPVVPGTYTVAEVADANYTQTSAVCDDLATQQVEQVSPTNLVVGEAQQWRCTFVNTAKPGSITVAKVAHGADGTFDFTSNVPDLGSFSLTTTGGQASSAKVAVPVGTYAIGETVPARWQLTGSTCTGQQSPGAVYVGPGQDVVCTFTNQAPDPSIEVTKTALATTIGEPGGSVTYQVSVTNTSVEPVTIFDLTDSIEGATAIDITATGGPITATTCGPLVGQVLTAAGPGATATCTFTATVSGDDGDVIGDVVTVTAYDSSETEATDSDDASVAITALDPVISVTKTPSVASIAEPGGTVSYTVQITNDGVEPVTVSSLTDSLEGAAAVDATTTAGDLNAGSCATIVGTVIAPGASASCTFSIAHVVDRADLDDGDLDDTVTVVAADDDGTTSATADAEVVVTDAKPTIVVTKTAAPGSVAETAPGQTRPVAYTVTIQNTSAETVTIDAITDAVGGGTPFAAGGTCTALIGTTLAAGAGTSCEFTLGVAGDVGDVVTDVATVTASDNDGNSTSDDDDASVTITGLSSSIDVTKTASVGSVPEPGGDVTYTVEITNTSPADSVTIGSIVDSVSGGSPVVVGGTCSALIGTTLAPGEKASCAFTMAVSGDAGDVVGDTVTVTGTDDDGESVSDSGDETVTVTDVASSISVTKVASVTSVDEPGGAVTFTVGITNTSVSDSVTIDAIVDSVSGGPAIAAGGTCPALIGTVLAPGGTASCTFTLTVSGNAGDTVPDTVTVTGTDDDEGPVSGEASEVVDVKDVASSILVAKTPSVESLPEPGGDVTYTVNITNTSTSDSLTIDSIVDVVGGGAPVAVAGTCDDLIGTVLAPGQTVTCTFTMAVSGDAGDAVVDTVTVTGTDDDQGPVTGSDGAVVDITDVAPTGTVTKEAQTPTVPEPGGGVTFTASVTNTSTVESATVTAIADLVDGTSIDVTQVGGIVTATTCATGAVLAPGATYSCTFTLAVTGNAGATVVDQVSFTLADDDGGSTTPTDVETVTITDVLPTITVTKDNGDATLAAPGGSVTFDVVVTNTSVEPVTLTKLLDSIAGGAPFDITTTAAPVTSTTCATGGSIAVGATYACSFTLAVESDEPTTEADVVDATAVDDEGNPAVAGDGAVTVITPVADLAIDNRVVDDDGVLQVGDVATYELEVTNLGPSTAMGVVVVDELPAGLVPTAASGDGWACTIDGQRITCTRPSLAPGDSTIIEVTVDVGVEAEGLTLESTATVSSDTPDPNLANNTDPEVVEVPFVEPETEESTTTTTTAPSAVVPETVDQGTLPRTGSDSRPLVGWAVALIAVGGLLVGWRRFGLHRLGRSVD